MIFMGNWRFREQDAEQNGRNAIISNERIINVIVTSMNVMGKIR